jgi:tRNA(Ile2) C34 agmatinyltransferase TiaS
MGIGIIGYVIIAALIVGVIIILYKVSATKRLCPHCRTMMPMKITKCPKCGKQIPLNY